MINNEKTFNMKNLTNELSEIKSSKFTPKNWHIYSESEKTLLRKSWSPVFIELEEFGMDIYEMIFEQVLFN